jgi:hypothetical protein
MRSLSAKQQEILKLIVRGNPDGSFIDLDELLDRLSYKPTKDALQFSIRHLVKRELIEKKPTELRRNAKRRVFAPTMHGYAEYRDFSRT